MRSPCQPRDKLGKMQTWWTSPIRAAGGFCGASTPRWRQLLCSASCAICVWNYAVLMLSCVMLSVPGAHLCLRGRHSRLGDDRRIALQVCFAINHAEVERSCYGRVHTVSCAMGRFTAGWSQPVAPVHATQSQHPQVFIRHYTFLPAIRFELPSLHLRLSLLISASSSGLLHS